jgi:hypothetical protein
MKHLLVSTRKGLFTVAGEGDSWKVVDTAFVGDRVTLACTDPRDGTWFAALDHGHFGVKLHRSDNRGESWEEIAAPAYPEKPEGHEDKDGMGQEIPWTNKLIWSLAPAGADKPGVLWCGTIPGALFRSPDRGDTWELVESLWNMPERNQWFGGGADWPGIHSVCVHPDDSNRVLVGVSCGGVWETVDDGASWNNRAEGMFAAFMPPERRNDPNIQDPHCIVQCAGDPSCLWTQHHNGVFRSIDGAASWQEVKVPPSSFGFATRVHPADPKTAWFVPAVSDEHRLPVDGKLVVTRTRDGGESFEVLRQGLPQEHAYDLVFRHALDVDDEGGTLAFGSTTGSLWVSEDQGDRWHVVSHHLPPIYAVTFVR